MITEQTLMKVYQIGPSRVWLQDSLRLATLTERSLSASKSKSTDPWRAGSGVASQPTNSAVSPSKSFGAGWYIGAWQSMAGKTKALSVFDIFELISLYLNLHFAWSRFSSFLVMLSLTSQSIVKSSIHNCVLSNPPPHTFIDIRHSLEFQL